MDENSKAKIKHLISYGVGVWVSVWKNPSIKLFHSETMKHVQDINIVSPVTKMQRGKYLVEMTLALVVENSDENDQSNSPFSHCSHVGS